MRLLSFGETVWDIYPDKARLGGAPLNLAAHAVMQGWEASLVSAVGDDSFGSDALAIVQQSGVDTSGVTVLPGEETTKCLISFDAAGHPSYRLPDVTAFDFISPPDPLPAADVIAFGTLALRGNYNRRTMKEILHRLPDAQVFTDINLRTPFYDEDSIRFCLASADIVKMSDEELPIIEKMLNTDGGASGLAADYPNLRLILITRGASGANCYDCASGRMHHCPALPVKVVSTVGAGDSFCAAFLAAYRSGGNIDDALSHAAAVSALVCTKAEVFSEEIRAEIHRLNTGRGTE